MSDNDLRHARVLELGAQTKLYLDDATKDYDTFKTKCTVLKPKIVSIYQQAGLTAPSDKQVEILEYTQVGRNSASSEVADVLEVIADIGVFVSTTKALGPPANKWLKQSGKMSEANATKLALDKSINLYDDALSVSKVVPGAKVKVDIKITGVDMAGTILAGLVAGAAVDAIDLAIFFAEQSTLKAHLKEAITALHPLRTAMLLAKRRTRTALDSLSDTEALLDALEGRSAQVTAKALQDGQNVPASAISRVA